MELSSLEANGTGANSDEASAGSPHNLQLQQTQSLPNLNIRQRQPLLSVRLPPIEHIRVGLRGGTNAIQASQRNESDEAADTSSHSGSGQQQLEARSQLPETDEQSLSNSRQLIQQIFYQTQSNAQNQNARERTGDLVNSGQHQQLGARSSPFNLNALMQQRRSHAQGTRANSLNHNLNGSQISFRAPNLAQPIQTSTSTTQLPFSSLVSQQNESNRDAQGGWQLPEADVGQHAGVGNRTSRFTGPFGGIQLNEDSASHHSLSSAYDEAKSRSPRPMRSEGERQDEQPDPEESKTQLSNQVVSGNSQVHGGDFSYRQIVDLLGGDNAGNIHNIQDDLNFENIDILEDELHHSSNAAGGDAGQGNQAGATFLDSSIQRYGSSNYHITSQQEDSQPLGRVASTSQINQGEVQSQAPIDRNLTISRMLQLYRDRRRAGLQSRGENNDVFVPRTLTQNFMNNASANDNRHGGGALSHSHGVNIRSESFRRNIETMQMDHLVNQLRSERRNEDTDTFGTQNENLENIENISINNSNSAGNNFDHTASVVSRSRAGTARTLTDQRNQVRRPMTRAAGYDSRLQTQESFFNLNGNSPRQEGNSGPGAESLRRNIHLNQNRERRDNRSRQYLSIFQQRIPTYDDNFLSRSETQIQRQFHQRSRGLAPRLLGANASHMGLAHYQSIQHLPTLNEAVGGVTAPQPSPQNRGYRSRERLYNADGEDMLIAFPNLQEDCLEENINQSQNGISSSEDDGLIVASTYAARLREEEARYNEEVNSASSASETSRAHFELESISQTQGYEDRFLRNVRNVQVSSGSNIGRGTHLISSRTRRLGQGSYQNMVNEDIYQHEVMQYRNRNGMARVDKRSKMELCMVYNKLKENIPEQWRIEELSKEIVTGSRCLLDYLENYGPLSALIFSRTQSVAKLIEKEPNFDEGSDLSELVYLSVSGDIMDFMKFIQRILSFYQYNFDQAVKNQSIAAKHRLDKLINRILPSCKELLQVLKDKRKRRQGKITKEFPSDDENIIYIVILKILESYHLQFPSSTPNKKAKTKTGQSSYEKRFLPLAIELYKHHVNSSDLILLNSLLRCGSQFHGKKKMNPSLHSYFSNLSEKYSQQFIDSGHLMLEKEDYLAHFNLEKLKMQNRSRLSESQLLQKPHEFAKQTAQSKITTKVIINSANTKSREEKASKAKKSSITKAEGRFSRRRLDLDFM